MLGVQIADGEKGVSASALPPWWITRGVEPGAPDKDMGGYTVVQFTLEQQKFYGIDVSGEIVDQAVHDAAFDDETVGDEIAEEGDGEEEDEPGDEGEDGSDDDTPPEDNSQFGVDQDEDPLDPKKIILLREKLDTNKDGKLSMEELVDHNRLVRHALLNKNIADDLKSYDRDEDGKISLSEWMPSNEGNPEDKDTPETPDMIRRGDELNESEKAKFEKADKNGDGFLDEAELAQAAYPELNAEMLNLVTGLVLKHKDDNKDGKLDMNEFWLAEGADGIHDQHIEDFKALDLNNDKKLDHHELSRWESGEFHSATAFQELFDAADKDKDGYLSYKELDDYVPEMQSSNAFSHFADMIEHHEL